MLLWILIDKIYLFNNKHLNYTNERFNILIEKIIQNTIKRSFSYNSVLVQAAVRGDNEIY